MNKLAKGAVAGAAGVALLLGGAGTFALWNDSSTVSGTTISSGELAVATATPGGWSTAPELWVPGDTYTYTEVLTVSAVGDNIEAELSTSGGVTSGDADLAGDLTVVSSASSTDPGFSGPTGGVYTIDEGTYTVTASVEVTFYESSGNATQNQTATVAPVVFSFTQIAP